jgi:hypothetical protein
MPINGDTFRADDELFMDNHPELMLASGCFKNPVEVIKTIVSVPFALLSLAGSSLKNGILNSINKPDNWD